MHLTLSEIQQHLGGLIAQLQATVPSDEPFGNAHGNWSFPGLTREELKEEAQSIIDLIEEQGNVDELGEYGPRLQDYTRRLQHLQQQTIPNLWNNAHQAVPAYLLTLSGLRKTLEKAFANENLQTESATKLRKLAAQLRAMELQLNGIAPRTVELGVMIDRIENAFNAADQLPADLDTLAEARKTIAEFERMASRDQAHVLELREKADEIDKHLKNCVREADATLERCETAYSAATSVGLAAAFSERSNSLSNSMWIWVGGLVSALAIGSYFGSNQLHALSELVKVPNASSSVIALNLFLSLLSVGAPVWFSWLATKQIGQRFRLAEDYAFKASVSRAYEGFRRETARFDKDMEARLLSSALTRLDELPLRLVETDNHGSPWHELASSDIVKQAVRTIPGFTEQVKDFADKAVGAISAGKDKQQAQPVRAQAEDNQ